MLGYIDPGTGSMVVQIVAGSIIGGMFLLKNTWNRFKLIAHKAIHHQRKASIISK